MENSKVYTEAARLVSELEEDNHTQFSCIAVTRAGGSYSQRQHYVNTMGHAHYSCLPISFFTMDGIYQVPKDQKQLHRSLALLFMAEYVKDGE